MYLRNLNTLGWLWSEVGDVDRAIDYNRRGTEGARKRGDPETMANAEINVADILLNRGDLRLAEEIFDGVYRIVKDPSVSEWMKWRYSTHLFASLADLWLAKGDYGKATHWANQCLEVAVRTGAKKNIVKGWRAKGVIAMRQRRSDEAEHAVSEALTIAQAIGNPGQLWRTYEALGLLRQAQSKPDEAHAAYVAARHVIEGVRTRLTTPELCAALDRAAFVQRLAAASAPR